MKIGYIFVTDLRTKQNKTIMRKAVALPTELEFNLFIEKFNPKGLKKENWNQLKELTCVAVEWGKEDHVDGGGFAARAFYEENGFTIITLNEWLGEKPKPFGEKLTDALKEADLLKDENKGKSQEQLFEELRHDMLFKIKNLKEEAVKQKKYGIASRLRDMEKELKDGKDDCDGNAPNIAYYQWEIAALSQPKKELPEEQDFNGFDYHHIEAIDKLTKIIEVSIVGGEVRQTAGKLLLKILKKYE